MEKKLNSIVNALRTNRVRRRRFTAVMIVLSMIVSSSVFWQLHSTGNAMSDELLCGMSEHVHTAECLAQELACGEDHEHTQECYKVIFTCGGTEHLHTEQCRSDISADTETAVDWELTLPEKMTDDIRENLAAVAESQLGYTESTNNFIIADDGVTRKGYTRYGEWYGNPYGDWNALFAYFCLYYAGITENELPYGSGCWAWTEELKKAELFSSPEDITVSAGDLVFLDTDSDEKPDRVGIVSGVKDEKTGITFTAIEGDLGDAVDRAEYSLADEMLAGFVSMDMLAESDMGFQDLSLNASDIAVYSYNNNPDVRVNGELNRTMSGSPLSVFKGQTLTVEIYLYKDQTNHPSAYFYETNQNDYNDTPGYQKFEYNDNGTTRYYKTPANAWVSNTSVLKWERDVFDPQSTEFAILKKVYTIGELGDSTFTYNNCTAGGNEDLYVRSTESNFNITSPTQEPNTYTSPGTPYVVKSGTSITVENIAKYVSINDDQYTNHTYYEYIENDAQKQDWRYHDINGKKIYTLANSWGIDKNDTSSGRSFSFNSAGDLICRETITLNLAAGESEKYVTYTFQDHDRTKRELFIKVESNNQVNAYEEDTIYYRINGGGFVKNDTASSKPLTINVGETVDILILSAGVHDNDNGWFYPKNNDYINIKDNGFKGYNGLRLLNATITGEKVGNGGSVAFYNAIGGKSSEIFFNVVNYKENTIYYSVNGEAFRENDTSPSNPRTINVGDTVEIFLYSTDTTNCLWDPDSSNSALSDFENSNHNDPVGNNLYKKWTTVKGIKEGSGHVNFNGNTADIYFNVTQQSKSEFVITNPSYHKNNFTDIEHAFEIKAGESFTLQGKTTNYEILENFTDEQYNNLPQTDKDKIKKASYIEDDRTVYVKTTANIWDFDFDIVNNVSTDTHGNFNPATWSFHINSNDELLVDVKYPTKPFEGNSPSYSRMSFNDGTGNVQHLYVKIKPKYKEENFYVVGAFMDRNKDRINEDSIYVDWDSSEIVDGYIKNSVNSPYILHKGDYVEVFVYVDGEDSSYSGGYFSCEIDGSNPLERVGDERDEVRNGRRVRIKKYKVNDSFNINGHADVLINYNYDNGRKIPFYVRVAESCPIRGQTYSSTKFDHYDIEIADGGTYTDKRTIKNADGSKVETYYVYKSFVSQINNCYVYNANGDLLTSLSKDDYTEEEGNNGTQIEFTSKFELQKDSKKDHHQLRSQVKNVVFDVDVLLSPLNVTTIKYDANGNIIDSVTDSFTGAPFTMKNVEFNMGHQDIIDAANKCPDHSGLDFTVTQSVDSVIEVTGVNFEVTKVLVDSKNNQISQKPYAGTFAFMLYEEKNGEKTLVDAAFNDENGKVKFDRYEFFKAGDYIFYIKELVPYNTNGITYDPKELKVVVTVTDAGGGKLNVSTTYQGNTTFTNTLQLYELPSTGSCGAEIIIISGGALMLTAVVIHKKRRRKPA